MKTENHKKIAEIISKDICFYRRMMVSRKLSSLQRLHAKQVYELLVKQANRFADYFEEEDKKWVSLDNTGYFSRKQFLKDCGVQ